MSILDDIRSGKGLPPISPKDGRKRADYIIPKSCELCGSDDIAVLVLYDSGITRYVCSDCGARMMGERDG